MKIIQVIMRALAQFFIVYSLLYKINIKYYSTISRKHNLILIAATLASSILYAALTPLLGLFANLTTFIPIVIVQKFALHYSDIFIALSNIIAICCFAYTRMLSNLTSKLFSTLTDNITDNAIFFTSITLTLVYYIALYLFFSKAINKRNDNYSEITNRFKLKKIFIVIGLLSMLVVPNYILYIYNILNYSIISLVVNICTIIISCIIFYNVLFSEIDYCDLSFNLEQEKMHNKTLCELVDSLRLLKHDYNNILQSINGYIITEQYDLLADHMRKLIDNTRDTSNLECINPKIINQPAIYGIVGAKFYKAKNNNIPFKIEVFEDISSISFDSVKLSKILGILLDNAIEAAQKSDNPLVEIKFIYDTFNNNHVIKIKNTFKDGIKIDLNKIFEKGESSKKIKSGLGLWEVKQIIDNEDNVSIQANITDNNRFVQTLVC